MFEDGAWEGFDFGETDWSPAEGMPCDRGGFHAGADGEVTHLRLEAIDDIQQVRAISQGEDVQSQREASEEGEEEFHVREAINLAPLHLP